MIICCLSCFRKRFFYNIIDIIDGFVIVVSFVVDMIFVAISSSDPCEATSGEDYAK